MIFCIPAGESKGLDSRFEPDFGKAVTMVVYDANTQEVRQFAVDAAARGAKIPAHFETVLCGRIDRDVWRDYLYQGVRFFGMNAASVREALEKYRKGEIVSVHVSAREEAIVSGCGCGRHGPGSHSHASASHACCGGKGHGTGTCGGHGKKHGGCGCG